MRWICSIFVKHCGMTPMDALVVGDAATAAQIMTQPGTSSVRCSEGQLADLLLVDGDPLADLAILLDRKRLLAIMKDGVFHKAPEIEAARTLRSAVAA